MLPQRPNAAGSATPDRLPNYLLASSGAPSAAPPSSPYGPGSRPPVSPYGSGSRPPASPYGPGASPPPQQMPNAPVAFNERLRPSNAPAPSTTPPAWRGRAAIGAPAAPPLKTPSRMPPNKSLLDSGPPSVLNLRSPSAQSPGMSGVTPVSASRATPASASRRLQTPASASPAVPGVERWVTVFGFPPTMESQVLREFRRHGEVVRTVAGRGNWIHIMYRTAMQAQVALYKPWRLLSGSATMVGTAPCTEPHVARDMEDQVERGILVASPLAASGPSTPMMMSPSPANHQALRTPSSILRRDQNTTSGTPASVVRTPQPQKGLFSYLSDLYG